MIKKYKINSNKNKNYKKIRKFINLIKRLNQKNNKIKKNNNFKKYKKNIKLKK